MSDFNAVLPTDIIRGAGVLYINGDTAFGASDGSLNFDPRKTINNTEYDGKISKSELLDYVTGFDPLIAGTFFPFSATKMLQYEPGSTSALSEGLTAIGTLAIDAVPEKYKTTTTATYVIDGVALSRTAVTAQTFSSAHVVSANCFGVIVIQVNAAGTLSTKVVSATQSYVSAAAALAAKPAPDDAKVELGVIKIAAGAADWTANTSDMTNASDLTTATFVDQTILVNGVTTVTPKSAAEEYEAGDYLTDVRLVFPRSSGGFAWVKFAKALITTWKLQGANKSEAKVSCEIEARLPSSETDINVCPYVVEFGDVV
jgi:hypothetical protein